MDASFKMDRDQSEKMKGTSPEALHYSSLARRALGKGPQPFSAILSSLLKKNNSPTSHTGPQPCGNLLHLLELWICFSLRPSSEVLPASLLLLRRPEPLAPHFRCFACSALQSLTPHLPLGCSVEVCLPGKEKRGKGQRKARGKQQKKAEVDILSPAAMLNLYYIAHNVADCLHLRGFPWPGAPKGKKGRNKT
ncbi:PREDICTED: small lysine-rich protein 1 [Galeopterus variegatus]|uniref:Small lysine-rich protein 1 n=1 Tax=Galeopterus variegatus TaxID=482537 RepID=A0ABM0RUY9_GALVR|nr:PREDICTED: small lysine-rich protein 1 [Galeopterus variegatus]